MIHVQFLFSHQSMSFLIGTLKAIMHRVPAREDIPQRGISDIQNREIEKCKAFDNAKGGGRTRN